MTAAVPLAKLTEAFTFALLLPPPAGDTFTVALLSLWDTVLLGLAKKLWWLTDSAEHAAIST
eukprot:CAMPEP_0204371752 /NCGR_PEP_ID=MMETSP0469-20131031/46722_1 /ASSEMBLY_ACC=CAM_ASM_000384 /TAXON_ID=2969 /ORGANISM="Oxyrrhis marina" /LENGTH=61 /DNA_ID=CAMNT_0051361907 /DNA_START=539 /DNA_END=724 /DNA_ORIENTATION=+